MQQQSDEAQLAQPLRTATELNEAFNILTGSAQDPEILAKLSTCSSELRDRCSCVVRQRIKSFLPGTVCSATAILRNIRRAVIASVQVKKYVQMVSWLCSVAGPAAINSGWETSASAILGIHDVPWGVAKPLVAAGVRLTLSQLKEACVKRVSGVEVWVKACKALSLDSGLPAAEEAICCDNTDALGLALAEEGFGVLPQGAANSRPLHLLQIALNMKSSQPAEYILETHSDALKAAIQHKVLNDLLRTAVRRTKHGCFWGAGCSEDPTEEGVGGRRGGYVRGYNRSVVMMLCTFPAAQELSQKDVGDLMGLAIRHAPYLMELLHPLPGAQRLTEGDLDDLLLKSARFHDDDSLNGLSKLQVDMDPDSLLTALISAMDRADLERLGPILDSLDARQAAALMIAHLQHPDMHEFASRVINLVEGTQLMSPEQWLDVLRADMAASDYHKGYSEHEEHGYFARNAWCIPEVRQLDRAAVCGLLQQAVLLGRQGYLSDDFMVLLKLDQAPDAGTLNDLLQTALQHQNLKLLTHICQQQWARSLQLDETSAASVVMAAAADSARGSGDNISPSQMLEAAMQGDGSIWHHFGVDPLMVKLHRALVSEDFDGFLSLCKQATTGRICSKGVVTLFAGAVATDFQQQVPAEVLEAIHSMLMQADIDVLACVTTQLHIAIQLRRDAVAAALCRLHNPQLSPEQCEDLLRRAAQMGCHQTVAELCGQAAFQAAIGRKAVYRLLLLATVKFAQTITVLNPFSTVYQSVDLVVKSLLSLPAVWCLSVSEVTALMKLAVDTHQPACLDVLTLIPMAQMLDLHAVKVLCDSALQQPLVFRLHMLRVIMLKLPHFQTDVALELLLLMGGTATERAMQTMMRSSFSIL